MASASAAQEDSYLPFSQRPGWEDLQPIPQADAPNALVPIAYTEHYRDAMDTFRALVAKGEKSPRAIEVTEQLIRMNPGHYSIWAYRAETLLATNADLSKELDLMDELVKEHIKSYQVWQHRRTIVTSLQSSTRELPFTTRALSFDSKNYHTWAYRQWVLCHFFSSQTTPAPLSERKATSSAEEDGDEKKRKSVWQEELEYTRELLEKDVRNNSAWNHRFFVVFESGEGGGEEKEVVEREIRYTKTLLSLAPNNPSAWNYLRGILSHSHLPLSSLTPFVTPLALNTPASMPADEPPVSDKAELPAVGAVEWLADAGAEEAEKEGTEGGREKGVEAAALFRSLIQFDPIRTNYWQFRADEVLQKVGIAV
ncbi:hypothetical protein BCR35DRAFT_285887 [Leucosporidium creatinivorum]|uniref:Protein farnesyltransferase/geranylgeranyltransferase type-1 subunit alpha n=1 Tax=Leucosporidium creatinivorum TaxID=106004 RepID=A0A1Y2G3N1_9BASI|nr:hypothetical protein BCR35DRAFT_285887 [Leucosporidium creatinivorum]